MFRLIQINLTKVKRFCLLNRKIIQMATVEEDQELVDILTAAKRTYEDEYNTFFAVIERKQEQQEGAREG